MTIQLGSVPNASGEATRMAKLKSSWVPSTKYDSQSEAPSTDPARLESFSCLCALSHTYLYDICTGIQAPPDTSHCLFFLCPDNTDGVQMDGVLLITAGHSGRIVITPH